MEIEQPEPKQKISCRTNEKIAEFIDYMLEKANNPTCEGCRFRRLLPGVAYWCTLVKETGDELPNCGAIADLLVEVGILKGDSIHGYTEVLE